MSYEQTPLASYGRADRENRENEYLHDSSGENQQAVDKFLNKRSPSHNARHVWNNPASHTGNHGDEIYNPSRSRSPEIQPRPRSLAYVIEVLQTVGENLPDAIAELQRYSDNDATQTKLESTDAGIQRLISQLEGDNTKLIRKLTRRDEEIKRLKTSLGEAKEEIQVIEERYNTIAGKSKHETEWNSSQSSNTRTESEMLRNKEEMNSLQSQIRQERELHKKARRDFKQKYTDLLKENDNLKTEIKDLNEEKNTVKRFKEEIGTTLHELERYKGDEQVLRKEVESMRVNEKELKRQLADAGRELEETKTRLSKFMSEQLLTQNPNIADLSDANRPAKIAERFQELYDDPWTDAFEAVEKSYPGDDEKSVHVLLQILTEAKKFCDNEAVLQMKELSKALLQSSGTSLPDLPEQMQRQLKMNCKANAITSANEVCKKYIRELEHSVSSKARVALNVKSYVQECVTVCWLMALQDPPVAFGALPQRMDPFDTNVYKAYTQSGTKIDYVVWPPLYLHVGGPLLTKGIAQAYKSPSDSRATDASKRREATRNPTDTTYKGYTDSLLANMRPHTASPSYPTEQHNTVSTTTQHGGATGAYTTSRYLSEQPSSVSTTQDRYATGAYTTSRYRTEQHSSVSTTTQDGGTTGAHTKSRHQTSYPDIYSSSTTTTAPYSTTAQAQSRDPMNVVRTDRMGLGTTAATSTTPLGQTARDRFFNMYGYYPYAGQLGESDA